MNNSMFFILDKTITDKLIEIAELIIMLRTILNLMSLFLGLKAQYNLAPW